MEQEVQALVVDNGSGMCKVFVLLCFCFLFCFVILKQHNINKPPAARLAPNRPALLATMRRAPCFRRSLVARVTRASWSAWVRRTRTSATRRSRSAAF